MEAQSAFESGSFDVIYIDADHSFNAVLNDLLTYETKLKPGGMFMGNDYLLSEKEIHAHYGVLGAVNHFCKTRNHTLLLVTLGEYSDFVLCREYSTFADSFFQNLIDCDLLMIELQGAQLSNYKNTYYSKAEGSEFFIPSI